MSALHLRHNLPRRALYLFHSRMLPKVATMVQGQRLAQYSYRRCDRVCAVPLGERVTFSGPLSRATMASRIDRLGGVRYLADG
ncbi:hypothetical protein [Gluconobacter cerinus]|uniref:hypothetical protein n=1 Tax=Gluconobacter cerinus TaxID=38307 RepID=UPI001B8CD5A9|nr:hypothetical protein [Gluconobacter cerinus]MBS1043575.1 hypothetical protein [Gluconobacter cerinus]